jgi:hypothetical protein
MRVAFEKQLKSYELKQIDAKHRLLSLKPERPHQRLVETVQLSLGDASSLQMHKSK